MECAAKYGGADLQVRTGCSPHLAPRSEVPENEERGKRNEEGGTGNGERGTGNREPGTGNIPRSSMLVAVTRRWVLACLVVPLLTAVANGQQTELTTAQLKQAAFEAPKLAALLELQPGATVADVGAGFGAWMSEFSRIVGPTGRVFATDVGAPQLKALRAWVERERMTNVTVLEGTVDSTNLPAGCCDAVLIRDVYHHLTNPDAIVRSMAAALKPGGRLALIDFPPSQGSSLPANVPKNRGGHGVPAEVVLKEVGQALTHVQTISPWAAPNQSQQLFLLLFRKP